MQAAIFNKFEQAEQSTTRRFGGTGLGLAISKELALLLGGDLTIESEEGRGAVFHLNIEPIPDDQISPAASPAAPVLQAEPRSEGALGLSLLVAEDLEVNRQVLAAICRPLGVRLTMTSNGREAIDALKEGSFDAVLMDLRMPVMDGLEATRRIRRGEAGQQAARTPIIALTANAMREHVDQSLAAGADEHVAKPISRTALLAALERCCGSKLTPEKQEISRPY
jgi:CheY-like chemotaxis protein